MNLLKLPCLLSIQKLSQDQLLPTSMKLKLKMGERITILIWATKLAVITKKKNPAILHILHVITLAPAALTDACLLIQEMPSWSRHLVLSDHFLPTEKAALTYLEKNLKVSAVYS